MSEVGSYEAEDGMYQQLVAYLDGELDEESSLQVERRLAEDEHFRRELQQLQRAWDLLDELPKSEVSEAFTQTTVEMVVLSAEADLEQEKVHAGRTHRRWWLVGAAGLAGSCLLSYGLFTFFLSRSNEQLVRDLPVIENIELYRVADSVEYLRQLQESGLFDEEIADAL